MSLGIGRFGSGTNLFLTDKSLTTEGIIYSSNGYISADSIYKCRAISKSIDGVIWYSNRLISTSYTNFNSFSFSTVPDFSNRQPITVGNHSSTTPGEQVGGVFGPSIIWSRALSLGELYLIDENPYQIFRPRRILFDLGINQQILTTAAGWRVLTLKDIPSVWDVLAEKESAAAWHVQTEKQETLGWDVLAEKQEAAAWNVLAEKQQAAAWRALASKQAVATWHVLHAVLAAISWHVLTLNQVSSAWRVLGQKVTASGWMIFTRKVAASSWSILASGPKVVAIAWRVLAERPAAASWHILTQRAAASGWRVLASKVGTTGWHVLNALVAASSWIIGAIASGHETIRLKSPITIEIKGKSEITTEVNLESKIW